MTTTSNNNKTTHKEQVIHIDHESFYEGRVFGELKSRATVHLEDGMLTAKIETPEETYHIEPSWRHLTKDNESPDQMIVYKESDVIHPEKTGIWDESSFFFKMYFFSGQTSLYICP